MRRPASPISSPALEFVRETREQLIDFLRCDPVVDLLQTLTVVSAQWRNDSVRQIRFGSEGVEAPHDGFDRMTASSAFVDGLAATLGAPQLRESEQFITRSISRPWPISVTAITQNVRNRIRSRSGNGSPLPIGG